MEMRVVFVEPLYQLNAGYVARVSGNFGVKELAFVNPRCEIRGDDAIKYSKHSRELLENAKVYDSIGPAVSGTFSIGTTGIWHKSHAGFMDVYTPERISEMIKEGGHERVSLVLGRDDVGLSKEELRELDAVSFIPSSEGYPVLNVSHALAIYLYELYNKKEIEERFGGIYATDGEIESLVGLFSRFLSTNRYIRDRRSVAMALRHIMGRANPTKKEIHALSIAFSEEREE